MHYHDEHLCSFMSFLLAFHSVALVYLVFSRFVLSLALVTHLSICLLEPFRSTEAIFGHRIMLQEFGILAGYQHTMVSFIERYIDLQHPQADGKQMINKYNVPFDANMIV